MENFDPIDVNFLINNEQVKQDASRVKADITGVDATAQKSAKNVSKAVKRAYDQSVQEVNEYTQAVGKSSAAMRNQGAQLDATKPKFNGLQNSINQLSREMPAFAVSAQTGILALSNNIPILADEIARLKVQNEQLVASGQKAIPVWRQMVKSLLSFGTVLSVGVTLLTIYGREIGAFFSRLFEGKKAIDEVKASQEALNNAYKSTDYQDAIKDVLSLRTNIDLAKQGMIDASNVVDQYNESLGKATGSAKNLEQAEQLLIDNADKYIQMMLYKSAANLALDEAAREAYESELKRLDLEKEIAQQEENVRKLRRNPATRDETLQAQVARLNELNKSLDEFNKNSQKSIQQRNRIFQNLQQQAANFGLDLFLTGDEDSKKKGRSGDSIVRRRQALLDRISAIDREYARKRMKDDEAEVQALRDKFNRIKELVERFNKENPSAAISLAGFDNMRDRAEQDLRQHQSDKRTEKIRKEAEAARKKLEAEEQKKYENLLEQLMTYQQRKEQIEKDYAEKERLLKSKYQGDDLGKRLELLRQAKAEELQAIDDAAFKESQLYRDMNRKVLNMTRDQIKEHLRLLKQILMDGSFRASDGSVKLLSEEQLQALGVAVQDIEKFLEETDPLIAMLLKIEEGFLKIGGSINNLSSSLEGLHPELAATLETMSDLAKVGADAAGAVAAFASGNIVSGIAKTIQVIAGLFQIAKKARESERKAWEEIMKMQQEAEAGERRLNALQRERNIAKAKELELTLKSLKAQKEALRLSQAQVQQDERELMRELQSQKYITGSSAEKYGGFLGIGKKTKVVNEYASLLGLTFEEIEELYEKEKLTDRAAELFEELRKMKEEGVNIQQQLNDLEKRAQEVFTGTTTDSVANGIINGLKNGYRAVEDFAQDMETMLQGAILNAIKYQALEEPLKEWYDAFAQFAESDGILTDAEASKLRAWYNTIVQGAVDLYDQSQGILDQNALAGNTGGGLAGALRREMTEATASELAGLYRATFDLQKRQYALDQRAVDYTFRIMESSVLIEQNTANAVKELKLIVKNTKTTESRDLGLGG
jgi:hypothetical protein